MGVIAPDLSRLAHDLACGAVSSGNQLHRRGIRPPETAPRAKRLKSGADTGRLNGTSWARPRFSPYRNFPICPLCSFPPIGMILAPPLQILMSDPKGFTNRAPGQNPVGGVDSGFVKAAKPQEVITAPAAEEPSTNRVR